MAEHVAIVEWNREGAVFTDNRYSRAHTWTFDGGAVVHASASPHVMPAPLSVAANVDPEEAFVAAIASCHMLWFLSLAATAGIVVERYQDRAAGTMSKNQAGQLWVSKVVLSPAIAWAGPRQPGVEEVERLHEAAHENCFIANSVKTDIVVAHRTRR
jgi:organic hydroperoxide reductase OsmC/OhrA